jgi:hypothetical protein
MTTEWNDKKNAMEYVKRRKGDVGKERILTNKRVQGT